MVEELAEDPSHRTERISQRADCEESGLLFKGASKVTDSRSFPRVVQGIVGVS